MNKKQIKELIFSNANEKTVSKTLKKWLTEDPSLINIRYRNNKNILHMLIRGNRVATLQALLAQESWQQKALEIDKKGRTMFHHVVARNVEHLQILELLMEHIPGLLNTENKEGNTPLHEAVLQEQPWAITCLVNHKEVNRTTKNTAGKTALALAANNGELRRTLLGINQIALQTLDLRFRTINADEHLQEYFPLLSAKKPEEEASSSHSSPTTTPTSFVSLESSSSAICFNLMVESKEQQLSEALSETNKIAQRLYQMIDAFKKDPLSEEYIHAHNQFNLDCEKYLLSDQAPLAQTEADSLIAHELIARTLQELSPEVSHYHGQIQQKMHRLLEKFIYTLSEQQHLMSDAEPRAKLDLVTSNKKRAEILWLLTACQEQADGERVFDMSRISNQALGLLSANSLTEIIADLRQLYPAFDKDQKIVANLLVMQLFFYHTNSKIKLPLKIHDELDLLYALNKGDLEKLGTTFNQQLETAFSLCSVFAEHPLLRNFHLLNQKINTQERLDSNRSFDDLIEQALSLKPNERKVVVQQIAYELRSLSIHFYQQVTLEEFHNNNWQKDNQKITAPTIVAFTDSFNKLSAYFQKKILTQTEGKLPNALRLLLELAQELCPLAYEGYPDLAHLMLISSIFNSHKISRLSNAFNELSGKEHQMLAEINSLTSITQNARNMREVYRVYRTTLPYAGGLLTDLTFATERNSQNPLLATQAVGRCLRSIIELKVLLNFHSTLPQTDLPLFLAAYQEPDEEELYEASLKQQPPVTKKGSNRDRQSLRRSFSSNFLLFSRMKKDDKSTTTPSNDNSLNK